MEWFAWEKAVILIQTLCQRELDAVLSSLYSVETICNSARAFLVACKSLTLVHPSLRIWTAIIFVFHIVCVEQPSSNILEVLNVFSSVMLCSGLIYSVRRNSYWSLIFFPVRSLVILVSACLFCRHQKKTFTKHNFPAVVQNLCPNKQACSLCNFYTTPQPYNFFIVILLCLYIL